MREPNRDHPTPPDPPRDSRPALAIVGRGRLGTALAAAARRAGLTVHLAGREDAVEVSRDADVALLCVPDEEIAAAAGTIAPAVAPGGLVGHTSGATGLEALSPALDAGASVFSLHPLQTVPDASADLAGAACAISGSDTRALTHARELGERLGMRPFELDDEQRAAYHAAAVIASNFLVTLGESAVSLLGSIGVPEPRELLAPLVLSSAANWSERGPRALTGPIARGDERTVARHHEALGEAAPELLELYTVLAARTRALAGATAAAGDTAAGGGKGGAGGAGNAGGVTGATGAAGATGAGARR